MKMTRATEYALILSAHLATLNPGENTNIRLAASECGIPKRFLANIVNRLANAGIVASFKGVNGGIRLARNGSQITVLEVVEAVEGGLSLVNCQGPEPSCSLEIHCRVKEFMDQTYHQLAENLNRTTIESLNELAEK